MFLGKTTISKEVNIANRLSAIAAYRPRIQLGNTVQKVELARYLADRTGLNEGSVELVIKELRDAIIFFNRAGRAVKIEGLGAYTPGIDLEGAFDVQYRADTDKGWIECPPHLQRHHPLPRKHRQER